MKPKISSLLLLLSAIAEASSGEHQSTNERGIFSGYADSSSWMQGITSRTVEKECHDFSQIARWINHRVVVTGKLTRFNQHLGQLLLALNDTAPIERCCFYEKATMDKIMVYLNGIAKHKGISEKLQVQGSSLKSSGELGQDLDNILNQMGKLIRRNLKSCCDQLAEDLKQQEADLQKQLEELRKKLENSNGKHGKTMGELQKKEAVLEKQLEDSRAQLEKFEEQLMKSGDSFIAKCCARLDKKLQDLERQATTVKNEGIEKAKELEKKLDDLKDGQKDQEVKLNDIQKTISKISENISNATDMCAEKCGSRSNDESNPGTSDLENRIEAVKKKVNYLSKRIADLIPSEGIVKENIKSCQDIGKILVKIETLLQQAVKGKNPSGKSSKNEISSHLTDDKLKIRVEDLEKQVNKLHIEVGRSRHCCKFLDGIGNDSDELKLNVDKLNVTFTDHISDLEKKAELLRKSMDEALEKIKKLGTHKASVNGSGSGDLQMDIDRLQQNLDNSTRDIESLQTQLDKIMGHISVLTKTIKDKFVMTEDLKIRLLRLEKVCEDLKKDVEKDMKLVKRIDDLEKRLHNALEKQKTLEIQVKSCLTKCSAMNSIDDLIDRIEDLEKVVATATTTRPTTRKRKKSVTTTTEIVAWVGGIDMVTPFVQE
ncbi:probable DNA double-strand break repair Rad50 ATPase [Drosophila guanche]|uniref:Blast:Autophagy-related protein 23 n=1 Tax=Drosophila guanche TaxID=7266 RepID=A0A3B0JTN6_DROGU|nr:probable DNA double-strand break repair Rad50 ATPase [Drosophila guanche]SPP76061.1 blast:Autophagy-related protein 23 [Drosophila guanche]